MRWPKSSLKPSLTVVYFPLSELLEKCREIRNEIIQEEEQYQVNDDITTDSGKGRNKEPCITCNEFIRWFHQFPILNLWVFFTNMLWLLFQLANRKRNCFVPIRSSFSFSAAQTQKSSWKKFLIQVGENLSWIRYCINLIPQFWLSI